MLCLVAHSHLPAVIVPVSDHEQPVVARPRDRADVPGGDDEEPDGRSISRAAVSGHKRLDGREPVREPGQDVLPRLEHPVDHTLRDDPLALPIALIQKRRLFASRLNLRQTFRGKYRVIRTGPVYEPAVLHVQHVLYDRVAGRWRVKVRNMPAVLRGVCTPEALLDHAVVQQVDLAEVHRPQAHACYGLVAVRFPAALPVDLLLAVRELDHQMRAAVVVRCPAAAFEDVQQPHAVAVHDKPVRLLR